VTSCALPQLSHIQETSSLQTTQIDSEVKILPQDLQEPLLYNNSIFETDYISNPQYVYYKSGVPILREKIGISNFQN
jgi:hypothetical protein